jgi:adenosylcobinamide-phosphate synthase
MSLLTILLALILEQIQPLNEEKAVRGPLGRYAAWLESKFNDGERTHGVVAWLVGIALPCVLLLALWIGLEWMNSLASFLLGLGVLYLTTGFRHFSRHFTSIQMALRMGELDEARRLLTEWRHRSSDRLGSAEIARLAIEEALLSSHRHVFAPLFWFVLLGPAGAALYRLAQYFNEAWGGAEADLGGFGSFAVKAFGWIDWLPLRLTATAFAVVGDFEDAVYCWRTQAGRWPDASSGILLSSGAGALGVRLGAPLAEDADIQNRPELGVGDEADADFMQSTIGLVWRSLVLGVLVLALLTVATWVGR